MAVDPQLLKGVLTLLLLDLLGEQESYGYDVVQRLHRAGLGDVAAGTVYPALSRLERDGLLVARLVPSSEGPARKYYRLTPVGRRTLDERVAQWRTLVGVVDARLTRSTEAVEGGVS